jgi:regulation of enolase protein 1 (concanavalin A-like superfamily)
MYFWGNPIAFTEPSPGAVTMSGIGTDIWGTADQFRFAYKPLSGNGSIIAKVDSLVDTDPWAKAGVMIRETIEAGSAWACVFSTGASGVRYQARLSANSAAISDTTIATPEQLAQHQPVWIKIERTGNDFKGYYSTDAKVWTAMAWNPQTIPMAANVYIGLAVTSHNADYPTTAQYTGVSTTGSVNGVWQTADIGRTQPTPNAPDTVYVAIEDNSRRIKVVSHPNAGATATGVWEEWKIPLGQFTSAGINLGSVTKMAIGVGDRNASKAGGKGKVYIDDIRLTRAATP